MSEAVPRHVAIIMDGNGRWAKSRRLPRAAGHKAGVESIRAVLRAADDLGVEVLSVFAFSTENWQRPQKEVDVLMELFLFSLKREMKLLHAKNTKICIIGDRTKFAPKLIATMDEVEQLTAANTGLQFNIAANYGGRWDICQAVRKLATKVACGELAPEAIDDAAIESHLATQDAPFPDLFIRTGGERRISNFLLWQIAYAELYFTDVLWPDFNDGEFRAAIDWFATRQRRFGKTPEQVEQLNRA